MPHTPPQPAPDRLTQFRGHPIVVGVVPDESPLVAMTAALLAQGAGSSKLYFAYADAGRMVQEELPDGSVRHAPLDPDDPGDRWQQHQETITAQITQALAGHDVAWEFRYLAGRADRALTHLARAVDAACFVVGAKRGSHRVKDFLGSSVSVRLSHHQHRPVVTVPLQVVDWSGPLPWE